MMDTQSKTQAGTTTSGRHTSVSDLYGRYRAVEAYQSMIAAGRAAVGMAVHLAA